MPVPRPAALAAVAALAAALGCGSGGAGDGHGAAVPAQSAAAGGAGTGGTPAVVVREIDALDGSVTPELWLQRHPGDSLRSFSSSSQGEASSAPRDGATWCVTSVRSWRDDAGRTITRTARFYAPLPTEPLDSLPAAVDPRLARTQCRLGLIGVWVTIPARAAHAPLADSLHDLLAARYGRPHETGDPVRQYWNSAFWRRPARWRSGPAAVVLAADSLPYAREPLAAFAFGYLPPAGLGRPDGDGAVDGTDAPGLDTAFSSEALSAAIAAADAPAAIGVALRTAATQAAAVHRGEVDSARAAVDSALVSALRQWLDVTAAYPPERRAAALLAADRVLTLAVPGSDAPGSPSDTGAVIRALTSLGAEYVYDQLGAAFGYTGNWIRAARTLDPAGPVGELAFLVQLEAGFGEPLCGGPHEGEWFRTVIAEGERYLRTPHAPARAARVHFLVAEAHRDIVAVANGAAGDYADAARYRAEEPAARARAAEHYRVAIALDPSPAAAGRRRRAWREAWRLLAGLAPADELRFFCVYD